MATILIVDDQVENIRLLKHTLHQLGHIVFAQSGDAALAQVATYRPDIILLDVVMPGIDGYATCRALKSDPSTAHIPVIFISSRDATEDEEKGLAAGAIDYVTKPFVPAIVQARVRNHLALIRAHADLTRANDTLRKFHAAIEFSPAGIMITDDQGRIEFVNPAFAAASGYAPEELIGQTPAMLRSEVSTREEIEGLWQTIRDRRVWRGELCNRRRDGNSAWEDVAIGPVIDENGDVTHYVAVYSDITLRREMEEELRRLAVTDALTGVANRRQLLQMGEQALRRAERNSGELSVLLLDIDYFKKINDTLGHPAGDSALVGLAQVANAIVRNVDLVARLGGEEFAVLLPDTPLEGAVDVAERLRRAVADKVFMGPEGQRIGFTISLGCASVKEGVRNFAELLSLADQALYSAKQGGRNRVAAL